MTFSCPAEIAEVMSQEVMWESFLGFDGHAEPTYAPAIPLKCWIEAHGAMADTGGLSAHRTVDKTVVEPTWDIYFSGDDEDAREIKVYDRFTPPGVGTDDAQKLQANRVNTLYGPPFDNRYPTLIMVST